MYHVCFLVFDFKPALVLVPHNLAFLHLLLLLLPMLLPSLSSLSVSAYVYAPVLMGNSGQVFCGLWGLLILNGDTRLE
jgi:hypothetical protein